MPLCCSAAQRLLFYNRRLHVHSLTVILNRARTSLFAKKTPYKNGM